MANQKYGCWFKNLRNEKLVGATSTLGKKLKLVVERDVLISSIKMKQHLLESPGGVLIDSRN